MSEPKPPTGILYGDGSIEPVRNRDDSHEETWAVSDREAADLLLSVEPVPDEPPQAA